MKNGRNGKSKAHRRALGRRVLLSLAVLLGTSGLVRLGGIGIAVADDVSALLRGTSASTNAPVTCNKEEDIQIVLSALQKRETVLVERETALAARMEKLATADQQLASKLDALVAAESKLAATLSIAETAVSDDLARLTVLYENMKPKQAIPLFETMEPQFAAGFLSRMDAPIAAKIMAGLDPQTAYAISVVFVGRHSNVPTN